MRLRRDRIVVALEHKVLVYNFADLRLLHSIETLSNPGGILALSAAAEQTILACPGLHAGQVSGSLGQQLVIRLWQLACSSKCIAIRSQRRHAFRPPKCGSHAALEGAADTSAA